MRKSLLIAGGFFLLAAGVTVAQEQPPAASAPEAVEAGDLVEAGYAAPQIALPAGSRFAGPVAYFRVKEEIDDAQAKKDCPDCRNLVAVYVGETKTVPGWAINQRDPVRIMVGRWQYRAYLRGPKTAVIVTGPDKAKVQRLGELLLAKTATGP